jgi:hypothetical protein
VLIASPANAAKKPDLKVTALVEPPASVAAGDSFASGDTTKNAGKKTAKASVDHYILTDDDTVGNGDDVKVGDRSLSRLRKRKSSSANSELTVPTTTPAGAYRQREQQLPSHLVCGERQRIL